MGEKIVKKMKALRLNAPKQLEYCEVPVPEPGLNEVLCKVESTSICGSQPFGRFRSE